MGVVMERNLSGNLVPMDANSISMTPTELQRTLASRLYEVDGETGKRNMDAIADNVIALAKQADRLGLEAAREVMDRVMGKAKQSIETLSVTATLSDYLDRLSAAESQPAEMDIIEAESQPAERDIIELEGL